MKVRPFFIGVCLFGWAGGASARPLELFTKQRDQAAASIGTTKLMIESIAGECVEILGEPISFPGELAEEWERTNLKYVAAAAAYVSAALGEAKRRGGQEAMIVRASEYTGGVDDNAMIVRQRFKKLNTTVCRAFVASVRAGDLDITSRHEYFQDLQEIVVYFERK